MGINIYNLYHGESANSLIYEELFEIGKKKTSMATAKLAKFTERKTQMTLKLRKVAQSS